MSSSLDGASPLLLEPSVTMHEEPGEVFLNSDSRPPFYNNGDIPAQISITKINPPASSPVNNGPGIRGNSFNPQRGDLAGIVPKGLRPVQIRPPPLIRGGAPGIPPPPRLQFAGIPTNIRPVNRSSTGSATSNGNPILGMMNVAKKVGNTPRFSSRRGPSPRCKQQQPVPRTPSVSSQSNFHPGVPGIKNVSPVPNSCRPMIRPGFRPVNVRMRGRPPLIKRDHQTIYPSAPKAEPKPDGEASPLPPVETPSRAKESIKVETPKEEVPQPPPIASPETPEKSVPQSEKEIEEDKDPSDPEISFTKDPPSKKKRCRIQDIQAESVGVSNNNSSEVVEEEAPEKKSGESTVQSSVIPASEDKCDQDEDKGATKFRFVRRADGKGFVKKSVKSTSSSSLSAHSGSVPHAVRKSYSSTVLKGIRKKKKKPFKGINYRFDGSIKKKKKSYFNSSAYRDDDDTSSIRSDRDLGNEHDVLAYLGIQRKDSTDSKSSDVIEESKEKVVISGPKARKSFGGANSSYKRPLEDDCSINGTTSKKTRTYTPRVGQFFPLPSTNNNSGSNNSCVVPSSTTSSTTASASTSVSASDEDGPSSPKEDEEEEEDEELGLSKVVESIPGEGGFNCLTNEKRVTRAVKGTLDPNLQANYICECEKSIDDLLLRRNSSTLCRAIESVGGSRVGCKNPIQSFNQLRPDAKLPKKVFCEIHTERLRAHQACGFCGEFCSHGIFYLCRPNKRYVPHVFHQGCYNKAKVKVCCHCGSSDTPAVVQMTLKMDRAPIQLLRTVSKMSFSGSKKNNGLGDVEMEDVIKYKMPNGKIISSHGLPLGLSNSVLQKVLTDLEDKAPPKHLTRNMYFPTKSGDAVKILQLLSQGYSPNQKFVEFKNGSPLHLSAAEGHVLNCHIFVQSGTELDSFDDSGNTPIHLAAIKGRTEVVRYLLQAGADIGLRGEDGMTCLHLAAQNGHLDTVKVILAQHNLPRNYLNLQDDGGWTPLVWACENKHEKIIKYLLMRGSNPLIVDAEGNIALHWASLSGSRTTCEVLMNYGCDVNARNTNGEAPLHIALRQDHYECAVLLLMRGANTNLKNKGGQLPVDCMAKDAKCATIMKLSTKLNSMMKDNKVHIHEKIVTNDVSKGKENCPIQCINAQDDEGPPKNYVYVRNNVVTSSIPIDRNHASLQHCKCEDVCSSEDSCNCSKLSVKSWYDLEGKLKSSFDYKEPPMIFECNDLCNCNVATCHNRVVQHGITSRMIVFRTQNMGWGVRALKDIPKGTFVCEYVGEVISDSEADTREDSYLFDLDYREGETYCIDANRFGNIARFINHSCNPNLTPVKVFAEHQDLRFPHIALFANRDIPKGTELGFDYGEKFWVIKHRTFTCHCGSDVCHYSQSTIQTFLKDYYQRFPHEHPETYNDQVNVIKEEGGSSSSETPNGVGEPSRRSSSSHSSVLLPPPPFPNSTATPPLTEASQNDDDEEVPAAPGSGGENKPLNRSSAASAEPPSSSSSGGGRSKRSLRTGDSPHSASSSRTPTPTLPATHSK